MHKNIAIIYSKGSSFIKGLLNFYRVKEDLDLADLEVVVDDNPAKAEHLDHLAVALAAFEAASESSEMSPGDQMS